MIIYLKHNFYIGKKKRQDFTEFTGIASIKNTQVILSTIGETYRKDLKPSQDFSDFSLHRNRNDSGLLLLIFYVG